MVSLADLRATQPRAVETLTNALANGRLHHAYALVGQQERPVWELARATAEALVCRARLAGTGCGQCAPCRKLAGGNHPDVMVIEPNDRDLITVDTIREVSARLALKAVESPTKVVIIRRADCMNPPAQNALLKILEEPPGPTCFLLTVTRFRAFLPTVRSRCQKIRAQPPDREGARGILSAAGIDTEVAAPLAALVGPDVDAAQAMVDAGAAEVLDTLRRILGHAGSAAAIVEASADLGADAARTELTLALLEVELRDRLAARHRQGHRSHTDGDCRSLVNAVDRLVYQRRIRTINPNRTLSLESVLLRLAGFIDQAPRARL